jgi:hypothetical protein
MAIASAQKAQAIAAAMAVHPEQDREIITKFASAEHLAHTIAYDLAANFDPKSPTVQVFDADGIAREYTITPIETLNPAILGFVLAGTESSNNRVHVVFRGTADKASMVRDAEYGGAGQESFHAEQDLILSQIIKVIGERVSASDSPVKLSVSGHSLGGGDAQNCAALLLANMAHMQAHKRYQEKGLLGRAGDQIKSALTLRPSGALASSAHAPLIMVDELTVNHVNSAGVPHISHERSKRHAKYLAKLGIAVNVRALRVAGDGIQLSGQSNILHDVDAKVANVEVFKVHSSHEGWLSPKMLTAAAAAAYVASPVAVAGTLGSLGAFGTFKAHTQHHFDKALVKGTYLYVNNATPEGAATVKHKLSSKSIMDNNPVSHALKKLAHTFSHPFVRHRKVAPHILSQYEMYKTDKDHVYNDSLLDAMYKDIEAANEFPETAKLILTH